MSAPATRIASTTGSSHRVVRFTSGSLCPVRSCPRPGRPGQRPAAQGLVARPVVRAAAGQVAADEVDLPRGPRGAGVPGEAVAPAAARPPVRGTGPGSGAAGSAGPPRPAVRPPVALRAATDPARAASARGSPCTPVHSTRARAAPGKAPAPPRDSESRGWRAAARSSRGPSLAQTGSVTSPRNASVRCHASRPVQRRPGHDWRSGATASSSSSAAHTGTATATNSLITHS